MLMFYKYTAKGNLVAVITNGHRTRTRDIGPEAQRVMEGKALLFKIFADIDVLI
jgi:malate dehydrogenase (oxaloacetate-decarboxylating)(NADP+)